MIDNWLVSPVTDAIREKAITGMSFRFASVKENWHPRTSSAPRLCERLEVNVAELGPVVSPAYVETSATVRTAIDALTTLTRTEPYLDDKQDDNNDGNVQRLVEETLEAQWGLSEPNNYIYTVEFHDDHAVVLVKGNDKGYKGLFSVNYTYNGDGTVSLGEPTQLLANGTIPTDTPPTDLSAWDPNLNDAPTSPAEYANIVSRPLEGDAYRAKYSADDRRTMAKNGQALPDGSYPIADAADLQNAIHAVGRGGGSHDAIRRHIIKRAKALGLSKSIPPGWNADGSMGGMNSKNLGPSAPLDRETVPGNEPAIGAPRAQMQTQSERDAFLRDLELSRRRINRK
jgi:hypothetical protein